MKKEEVIQEIKRAIEAHDAQLKTSRLIAYGMQVKEEEAALYERRCAFGTWLYGNMKWLKQFFGPSMIEDIEKLHSRWHNENRKIYEIYAHKQSGSGLFSKLFGRTGFKEGDLDRAKAYYTDLKRITEELKKRMNILLIRAQSRPSVDYEKIK
ncbi:hypothetical protein [Hydrogenimonas sp.]